MKRIIALFLVLVLPGLLQAADKDLRDQVTRAAGKLSSAKNYSWRSTSRSAEGTATWKQGPTEGKTEKGGFTYITFTLGDDTIEMAFHGDRSAIMLNDQWHGSGELKEDRAWIGDRLRTFKFAAEQAAFLAEGSEGFKKDGSALRSRLTGKTITSLLSRGRRVVKEAPGMTGTVQFWLKDNRLVRYEVNVKGTLKMSEDAREIVLDRTTTVEIHKVGQTKVDVPGEGRQKLKK